MTNDNGDALCRCLLDRQLLVIIVRDEFSASYAFKVQNDGGLNHLKNCGGQNYPIRLRIMWYCVTLIELMLL